MLLETEFDVVGTVADGRALVRAAANVKPDVIVEDIAMPVLNGLGSGPPRRCEDFSSKRNARENCRRSRTTRRLGCAYGIRFRPSSHPWLANPSRI